MALFKHNFLSHLIEDDSVGELKIWFVPKSKDACIVGWVEDSYMLIILFFAVCKPQVHSRNNLSDREVLISKLMDYLPSRDIGFLFVFILNSSPNNYLLTWSKQKLIIVNELNMALSPDWSAWRVHELFQHILWVRSFFLPNFQAFNDYLFVVEISVFESFKCSKAFSVWRKIKRLDSNLWVLSFVWRAHEIPRISIQLWLDNRAVLIKNLFEL